MTPPSPPPPGPGARRRGGRPRGGGASRAKILDAARRAFAANGYEGTSLRGIAREAGVEPSLIVHFYGSKAGVFGAVVDWPYDASQFAAELSEVPRERVGTFVARSFIERWDRDEQRNPIVSLIYAALADPAVATLLREFVTVNLGMPAVQRLGVDRPELRAALMASQLIGFGLSRYVLGFDGLRDAPPETLATALGESLQHVITAPLGPGAARRS